MKKMLLLSNMYPSENDKFYGIFVKNFEENMKNYFVIDKVVIKGRGRNRFEKIIKYLFYFVNVLKKLKRNNFDFIYVHYISHSLLPLIFFSKYINKPLILNAHGSDVLSDSKINKFFQKKIQKIVQNADLIVVPSHYFKNIVRDRFNVNQNVIFVSPSGGIDTDLFKPIPSVSKDSLFTIGYVSRIDEGKGWDTLLKAVRLLKGKGINNFKVMIIGGGSQVEKLQNMIKSFNLENIVEYMGVIPHDKLVYSYNKMNVFTFPTTRLAESLGLVGLEAMACGVPVIGSYIGGLKEYIKPNFNGEFFEPGNEEDLHRKIRLFFKMNKSKYEFYSKNAIQTAKKYSTKTVIKNLVQKIKEVINGKI